MEDQGLVSYERRKEYYMLRDIAVLATELLGMVAESQGTRAAREL
jgi:hypothetical protein